MNEKPFKTLLVGFGKIAQGYSNDPVMAKYYPYAAHSQVLRDHPDFQWLGVLDPSPTARETALKHWGIRAESPLSIPADLLEETEVLVLATPPKDRGLLIDQFKNLKGILVEKPLGLTLEDSRDFIEHCRRKGLLIQVNLWRRCDEFFRKLKAGGLEELVGRVQWAFVVYGNGLINNGTHMIDFVRMLLGEVASVHYLGQANESYQKVFAEDSNPAFSLTLKSGTIVPFMPLDFRAHREVGIYIWGEKGRLEILNEGLIIRSYPVTSNRAMSGELEIASDRPLISESTVGSALYEVFSDLANALNKKDQDLLSSPGESALQTSIVVETVLRALKTGNIENVPGPGKS